MVNSQQSTPYPPNKTGKLGINGENPDCLIIGTSFVVPLILITEGLLGIILINTIVSSLRQTALDNNLFQAELGAEIY